MTTQSSIVDLAALLMADERFDEAEPLYREVIASLRRAGPAEVLATNLVRYAVCLVRLERVEDAESTLLEAHRIQSAGGGEARDTPAARRLAELYERMGKPDEAARWRATSSGETHRP